MAGTIHLSTRDRMVYATCRDETWEGDTQSPSGAYYALEVPSDIMGIWEEFREADDNLEPTPYAILSEDSYGNLDVAWHTNNDHWRLDLKVREAAFEKWCSSESPEENPKVDLSEFISVPATWDAAIEAWNALLPQNPSHHSLPRRVIWEGSRDAYVGTHARLELVHNAGIGGLKAPDRIVLVASRWNGDDFVSGIALAEFKNPSAS